MNVTEFVAEIKEQLEQHIVPFWANLRDDELGGYYGYLDAKDLKLDKQADKGVILNNRIVWFFSNAYLLLKDPKILDEARHGYEFLKSACIDHTNGGVYWSLACDGTPKDQTKHTYNQAFAIYALSSYYEASGDEEARRLALELFDVIETHCKDEIGYLEAFTVDFRPQSNEKLSENGVMAEKTMNTLLHVMEAYTQLYHVTGDARVRRQLYWALDILEHKIYNPQKKRQEVFFDRNYNTILDLYSYGHDIETSWLLDRTLEVLDDPQLTARMRKISDVLAQQTYEIAYNGQSMANECEKGVVNERRIWWVQAEAVVGFVNAYEKDPKKTYFLDAAMQEWQFIRQYVIDHRSGSEWFNELEKDGTPVYRADLPIVGPWKCPYHNGRMCMEVIKRLGADEKL